MVLNLRKERVKKIALAYLAIILVPLNLNADIIFFKDGMKTVCEDRAWAEGAEVKCEYQGLVLTYQKNDVLRIEKIEPEKSSPKNEASSKTASGPAGQPPGTKQPSSLKKAVLKKKLQSPANNAGSLKATGLEFYNPRRPYKYWTGKNAKYNTFKEAVAALSAQYERSPEWIQHHMGTTNSIDEIHRNLRNPRRPRKYWTSTTAKHNTFQEAIAVLAEKYERSTAWVQQHIGNTNNLNEIHQNLANNKLAESSQ
jgi:hypothetical protein